VDEGDAAADVEDEDDVGSGGVGSAASVTGDTQTGSQLQARGKQFGGKAWT
jgi:hypothetical protein